MPWCENLKCKLNPGKEDDNGAMCLLGTEIDIVPGGICKMMLSDSIAIEEVEVFAGDNLEDIVRETKEAVIERFWETEEDFTNDNPEEKPIRYKILVTAVKQ